MNSNGLALLKRWEGLRLSAYQDSGGIWTIGYGHTSNAGPPAVTKGLTITWEKAEEILANDLKKFEDSVRFLVKVPINSNQFDALVSLCYNIGAGAFSRSTVLKRLNEKDYNGAANAFLMWTKITRNDGTKITLQGLVNRRLDERKLFLSKVSYVIGAEKEVVPEKKSFFDSIIAFFLKLFGRSK